ncbi:MAG: DUF948 domain-containing protein [Prochloraceae cyanobacterium]|nr:DUF948 domain-containing protein [Prochloraceae cyanobacterium]
MTDSEIDPLFWLGLSTFLVAVSLTVVVITALPALQELSRAARSAEKLFDTLRKEFPATLEAIRLTGLEISELTDEVNEGVKSATSVVKQVDRSVTGTKNQVKKLEVGTRSFVAGLKAAWTTWNNTSAPRHLDTPEPIELEPPTNPEVNWTSPVARELSESEQNPNY